MIALDQPPAAAAEAPSESSTRDGRRALRITGLNHAFGQGDIRQQVLFDLSLEASPGELVILTGASGCGKTTLLTLIGALRSVQDGSVQVLGRELHGLGKPELVAVRRHIGFIFQAHNLLDPLTAAENVNMAIDLKGYSPEKLYDHAHGLLSILHDGDAPVSILHGVPRNRAALARGAGRRVAGETGVGAPGRLQAEGLVWRSKTACRHCAGLGQSPTARSGRRTHGRARQTLGRTGRVAPQEARPNGIDHLGSDARQPGHRSGRPGGKYEGRPHCLRHPGRTRPSASVFSCKKFPCFPASRRRSWWKSPRR